MRIVTSPRGSLPVAACPAGRGASIRSLEGTAMAPRASFTTTRRPGVLHWLFPFAPSDPLPPRAVEVAASLVGFPLPLHAAVRLLAHPRAGCPWQRRLLRQAPVGNPLGIYSSASRSTKADSVDQTPCSEALCSTLSDDMDSRHRFPKPGVASPIPAKGTKSMVTCANRCPFLAA
jgi:hypothetical protein